MVGIVYGTLEGRIEHDSGASTMGVQFRKVKERAMRHLHHLEVQKAKKRALVFLPSCSGRRKKRKKRWRFLSPHGTCYILFCCHCIKGGTLSIECSTFLPFTTTAISYHITNLRTSLSLVRSGLKSPYLLASSRLISPRSVSKPQTCSTRESGSLLDRPTYPLSRGGRPSGTTSPSEAKLGEGGSLGLGFRKQTTDMQAA